MPKWLDTLLYETSYGYCKTTKKIIRPARIVGMEMDFGSTTPNYIIADEVSSPMVIFKRHDKPIKTLRIKNWQRKLKSKLRKVRSLICY